MNNKPWEGKHWKDALTQIKEFRKINYCVNPPFDAFGAINYVFNRLTAALEKDWEEQFDDTEKNESFTSSNWIPVSEQLPEIYQFVLTYSQMSGTTEPSPMTIARWDGKSWETLCNEQENNACACGDLFWATDSSEITNWMLLPKPPEGK